MTQFNPNGQFLERACLRDSLRGTALNALVRSEAGRPGGPGQPARKALSFAILLLSATANAGPAPVVGGDDVPRGKWRDAAGMMYGGEVACSGTLIAPNIALTAAHCSDDTLTHIVVGTNSLHRISEGELLPVAKRIDSSDADITVLVLGKASEVPPRAIASGWATFDIKNGASVAIVGYGAVDEFGSQSTIALQEAMSTITDFDCSMKVGCLAFELGAGGDGIDSCSGDSGGPLYLMTDYGEFLVGVTSRAYDDAQKPCGEGGIYGRPDQLLAFIEQAAETRVARGPEPSVEPITAIRGDAGESQIIHNDPKSDSHTYTIVTPPAHAVAKVRSDGRVRVCVHPDASAGSDTFTVNVSDASDPARQLAIEVPIVIDPRGVDDADCEVDEFDDDDEGGCCDSGGHGGQSLVLSLFVFACLWRRGTRRASSPVTG